MLVSFLTNSVVKGAISADRMNAVRYTSLQITESAILTLLLDDCLPLG